MAAVTGGGHGIGRAYCQGLASQGAGVVVAEIDADAAQKTAEDLMEFGHDALGFTRTLAREVGAFGITVNAIAPGSTLSEDNPSEEIIQMRTSRIESRAIPRLQLPEDLVGAVVFFASDDAAFITGQTLVVDGGATMR